jgi:hypothetical protein
VTLVPNCVGSRALLSLAVAGQMRAGAVPRVISCQKNVPQAPLGDIFVLDTLDQAFFNMAVAKYNAIISAKADSIGFAYVDPNPLLAQIKAAGGVPARPDITSPTAPFGSYISLDGIHPAAPAHRLITNALIAAINAKYHTSLATIAP